TGPAGILPFYASVKDQMTIGRISRYVGIGIGDVILGRHARGRPSPIRNHVLVLVAGASGVDSSVGGAASRDIVLDEDRAVAAKEISHIPCLRQHFPPVGPLPPTPAPEIFGNPPPAPDNAGPEYKEFVVVDGNPPPHPRREGDG